MRIGVPKESKAGERRVAATPKTVEQIRKLGYEVCIESGAGSAASFEDETFRAAGADIVGADVWESDIIFRSTPRTRQRSRACAPGRRSSACSPRR